MGWKYNPFTDKLDRTELPGDGDANQRLTKNDTAACGVSWQDKGVSYLQDTAGNILQDTAGNALEGIDTIDANLLVNNDLVIQELTTDGDIGLKTAQVFGTGTLTANLFAPTIKSAQITLRCISGTMTITADAGTVENDTLTVGQSTTLATRATGWFQV